MTIHFTKNLPQALQNIGTWGYHESVVHDKEEARDDDVLGVYGDAKWKIVDILNEQYSTILNDKFDLHNWLNHNVSDEVAYFINEVGSNTLSHSQFKAPHKFHLWLGREGFIIGVEQKGTGFDAEQVHQNLIKDNEGAAFDFFRNCKSEIFFDDKNETRTVFMESLF